MNSDLQNGALAGAVAACDAIGAAMLTRLTSRLGEDSGASGNVLACPVGLALALATLRAGAADNGTGIDAMLGVDTDAKTRDRVWSAVQRSLQRFDVADTQQLQDFNPEAIPDTPLLHIANNILAIGQTQPTQDYLGNAKRWYGAEVNRAERPKAKAALNAWAALHTGGLIKESGIDVTPDTRLVVQNALLFAARWAKHFNAAATAERQPFTRADGSTSHADLMSRTGHFTFVTGPGWRALRLPYVEGSGGSNKTTAGSSTLAMDIILPDDIGSPTDLPPTTWSEATQLLTAQAHQTAGNATVHLRLPRLNLSSKPTDLTDMIKSLGVRLGSQDHIAPDLLVDQVVQQVRLIVAEEGTVAAALTEITVRFGAPPRLEKPVDFTVDHPYVLRIVDLTTGIALIEAAILDPAAGPQLPPPAPAE
ncbi:serpin family protein [Actinomyces massiliensis]|uniref:serpin family protein n=1 Tax=Actinomyces massiliensis TaxID=461393 RepID=UPI0028F06BA6|nr:serpin family protein [Actinomyces massiliensis]